METFHFIFKYYNINAAIWVCTGMPTYKNNGNFSLILNLKYNNKSHYCKVNFNWLAWVYNKNVKNRCKKIKLRKQMIK